MMQTMRYVVLMMAFVAVVGCKGSKGADAGSSLPGAPGASTTLSGNVPGAPDASTVDAVKAEEAARQIGFHCGLVLAVPNVSATSESFCTQVWGNAQSTREQYVQNMLTSLNAYCGAAGTAAPNAIANNSLLLGGKLPGQKALAATGVGGVGTTDTTAGTNVDVGQVLMDGSQGGSTYTQAVQPVSVSSGMNQSELLRQMFCTNIIPFLYPSQASSGLNTVPQITGPGPTPNTGLPSNPQNLLLH